MIAFELSDPTRGEVQQLTDLDQALRALRDLVRARGMLALQSYALHAVSADGSVRLALAAGRSLVWLLSSARAPEAWEREERVRQGWRDARGHETHRRWAQFRLSEAYRSRQLATSGPYLDQCLDCVDYQELAGALRTDWGACTNPRSPFDGQVMFEHDGCPAFTRDIPVAPDTHKKTEQNE